MGQGACATVSRRAARPPWKAGGRGGDAAAARIMGARDTAAAGRGLGALLPEGVGRLAQLRGPSSVLCVEGATQGRGWRRRGFFSFLFFSFFPLSEGEEA